MDDFQQNYKRSKSFFGRHVLLFVVFAICIQATTSGDKAEDRPSSDWWLDQAVQHASMVEDADVRSDAYHQLAYVLGRNGNFPRAFNIAEKVTNPQKRVYAQTFVAKRQLLEGDEARLSC